jgi:hypothetical protein
MLHQIKPVNIMIKKEAVPAIPPLTKPIAISLVCK